MLAIKQKIPLVQMTNEVFVYRVENVFWKVTLRNEPPSKKKKGTDSTWPSHSTIRHRWHWWLI